MSFEYESYFSEQIVFPPEPKLLTRWEMVGKMKKKVTHFTKTERTGKMLLPSPRLVCSLKPPSFLCPRLELRSFTYV